MKKIYNKHYIHYYNDNNELHSYNDLPAVEWLSKYKKWKGWYKNNKLHRVGNPAVIYEDRGKEFWINGNYIENFYRTRLFFRKYNVV